MEGFLIDVGATTQHVLSSLIVSFKKKRNHNLCTEYIVEHVQGKGIHVKKVLSCSK